MSIYPHRDISERFLALWRTAGARSAPLQVYQQVLRHYAEPGRIYHTLAHIAHMLTEFDRIAHLARNPIALELAIWFHDIIYNPFATNSEELSAAFARRILLEADVDEALADEVARLILLTRHGSGAPPDEDDLDGQLLLDMDLSILGQSDRTYRVYERAIASEFSGVEQFHEKRAAFLEKLAARRPLFRTAFFRQRYEHQARRNMAWAIAKNRSRA